MTSTPRNCLVAFLVGCVMLPLLSVQSFADDTLSAPTKEQKRVGMMVAMMMNELHLSKQPLNDEISRRGFKMFVKALDPSKSYFLKSDIEEFSQQKLNIAESLKEGDYSLALSIYKRFLKRVDERSELAIGLVDADHDYTIDEDLITDPDFLEFAASEEEALERWRKRVKYNLLIFRADEILDAEKEKEKEAEVESGEAKPASKEDPPEVKLRKRYAAFARRMHQTGTEEVIEMFITAITSSYDPHTSYMSERSFKNFMIVMGLKLEGIGATLSGDDDGYTVIKSIVPGGACDTQGGIKVEDTIMGVAQGDASGGRLQADLAEKHGTDIVDVNYMKLDDVVAMIRGKAGTVVRLQIRSEGETDIKIVEIVREKISLEDSAAHGKVFEQGSNADGSPRKIGVIELPSFYADMTGVEGGRSTTADMKKILDGFNEEGVDGVVIDLRKNGGGSLQEAVDCTGLFIDRGTVVQIKDSQKQIVKLDDRRDGLAWEKPMVVLTSKFSASASEILAGALKDYKRAIIVGDTTTHGKGTVQTLMDIGEVFFRIRNNPTFGALKITKSQFYRPNGDSTQKRGVLSDLVLPSVTDKMPVGESDLDYPVEFDKIPAADFYRYKLVSEQLKQTLTERSALRVSKSEKFDKRIRRIEEYVRQKNEKTVSLNMDKYLERSRELSAEKEDEKVIEEQVAKGREIKRDFYLDEVLEITSDYLELLSNG